MNWSSIKQWIKDHPGEAIAVGLGIASIIISAKSHSVYMKDVADCDAYYQMGIDDTLKSVDATAQALAPKITYSEWLVKMNEELDKRIEDFNNAR